MKNNSQCLTMLLICLPAFLPAQPQVLALEPVADVSIFQDSATNASGEDFVLFVGMTHLGSARRALIRFDLSELPPEADVSAVTLTFRVERAAGAGDDAHTLHRVTRDWDEGPAKSLDPNSGGSGSSPSAGDVTWVRAIHPDIAWTTPGGDFATNPSSTTNFSGLGSSPVFSGQGLINDVLLFRDEPAQNRGWILIGNESGSGNARRLHSREATSPPTRPRLEITYTVPDDAGHSDRWFVF